MATKPIAAIVKLHIPAGQATPAPPVGPALAAHGLNIGDFCQKFNDETREKLWAKKRIDITLTGRVIKHLKELSKKTGTVIKKRAKEVQNMEKIIPTSP